MRIGHSALVPRIVRSLWGVLLAPLPALSAAPPVVAPAPAVPAEARLALVIGNGAYRHVSPLSNPPNDARLVADTLVSLGFQLVGDAPVLDGDRPAMERAIRTFGKRLRGGAVGLFYYAGHGVQMDGENYLVPVTANVEDAADVKYEMISLDYVLDEMKNAGNRLNIIVLDACRNNPFGGRGLRALARGLAVMQAPAGTIISYATQPGNTATDGVGKDSPFTRALTTAMKKPGLGVFETFNEVGLAVKTETGGQQQPWVANSPIEGNFQFRAALSIPAPPHAATTSGGSAVAGPSAAEDRAFWESVRDSKSSAELKAYLKAFPSGIYSDLAKDRLASLKAAQSAPAAAANGALPVTTHHTTTGSTTDSATNPAPALAARAAAPADTPSTALVAAANTATTAPSGPPAAAALLHYRPGASIFFQKTQTSATPVGGKRYEPLPQSAPVKVFESPGQGPRQFEVVATIVHADPCKMHTCALQDAFEPLSAKARELGANGIIIDNSQLIKTSVYSTGIAVDARAIRFEEGH